MARNRLHRSFWVYLNRSQTWPWVIQETNDLFWKNPFFSRSVISPQYCFIVLGTTAAWLTDPRHTFVTWMGRLSSIAVSLLVVYATWEGRSSSIWRWHVFSIRYSIYTGSVQFSNCLISEGSLCAKLLFISSAFAAPHPHWIFSQKPHIAWLALSFRGRRRNQ